MPDISSRSRPVDTVDDVLRIIESGFGSFDEFLDCIEICKDADLLDLRLECADRALIKALARTSLRPVRVIDAATHVVNAILRRAGSIEELPERISEVRGWFSRDEYNLRNRPDPQNQFRDFLSDLYDDVRPLSRDRWSLHDLVLLINDPEPDGLVRLSSRLRKHFDRSDLAVEAATRALNIEPDRIDALTTRGAGFTDLGEWQSAKSDLDAALRIDAEHTPALVSLSRMHQECNDTQGALDIAVTAFDLKPGSKFTTRRLMAAAAGAQDLQRFREALEAHAVAHNRSPDDPYIALIAIEMEVEAGQYERAAAALKELEMTTKAGLPTTKVNKLRRKIRTEMHRRQERLPV